MYIHIYIFIVYVYTFSFTSKNSCNPRDISDAPQKLNWSPQAMIRIVHMHPHCIFTRLREESWRLATAGAWHCFLRFQFEPLK